jgi:hypothetical protein
MQTKNKNNDSITNFIESRGFKYDLTEESGYSDSKRMTDYYRDGKCRFMLVRVNNPIDDISPNIILIDAYMGNTSYDVTTPNTDNCVFQGRIKSIEELNTVLNICMKKK